MEQGCSQGQPSCFTLWNLETLTCFLLLIRLLYLISEKKTVKSDQFFSGDQYFYPTNNFPRLKLTPTKNFF